MKDSIPLSFPHVMASDVSGEIVEVGRNVRNFKVGDAVFSRPNQDDAAAIAEYARVKESELAIKPANISHSSAAAVPLAGLTAWQALVTKGHLEKEDKVLIHAGSGGVGTFAIQIARHFGAHVATTVSARNIELVKKLGADEVIDYKSQQFEDVLSDYDLVFDMIGGDTLERSFKTLKKGGSLISIKGQDNGSLAAKHEVHFDTLWMTPNGEMLAELGKLIGEGIVEPIIDSVFTMDQVEAAYERLATGHAIGKIVVTIR